MGEFVRRFDEFQQRRRWLAIPVAVLKKRSDDQGSHLGALLAYYGFFSLFPLLLVFLTVLGFLLHGDPSLQRRVVDSTLTEIPVIGDQIQRNVRSLRGSTAALVIGLAGSLWAGLGVTVAAQSAFNRVWNVPHRVRPDFLRARLRGLALLLVLGAGALVSTVALGAIASGVGGRLAGVAGIVGFALLNVGLFLAAFRFLTAREVTTRELLPGAALAAVLWIGLQLLGGVYVNHVLRHATESYGLFGIVIGLLSFLYLGAQLTILAAEVNVVVARRLWPRSLLTPPLTHGDERALRESAKTEERVEPERVEATFHAG